MTKARAYTVPQPPQTWLARRLSVFSRPFGLHMTRERARHESNDAAEIVTAQGLDGAQAEFVDDHGITQRVPLFR